MVKTGDLVFLYNDEKRNFLLKVDDRTLHTDKGFIKINTLVGKQFGEKVKTNLDLPFYILRPYLHEMIMKVRRKTQILYPKDIGIIITRAHIFPGAKVIE